VHRLLCRESRELELKLPSRKQELSSGQNGVTCAPKSLRVAQAARRSQGGRPFRSRPRSLPSVSKSPRRGDLRRLPSYRQKRANGIKLNCAPYRPQRARCSGACLLCPQPKIENLALVSRSLLGPPDPWFTNGRSITAPHDSCLRLYFGVVDVRHLVDLLIRAMTHPDASAS
jgi:hypothetical protein